MKTFLASVGATTVLVGNIVARGYVVSILWLWFVVHTFPALPSITVAQGIALSFLSNYLLHSTEFRPLSGDNSTWESILGRMLVGVFLGPLFALGVGWVLRGFLP